MMYLKSIPLFISLLLLLPFRGNTQEDLKPVVPIEKIDELYQKWDNLEQPGIAVGVLSNGKIVHTKGYGLANLEYDIPVTAETKFYLGKIANQFTVLGLLLLEEEGKLSLQDDIQKHLPALVNLAPKISIIDIIQHTSGLRDLNVSKALSGWQHNDDITSKQAIQLVANQQQLNSIPKQEFQINHSAFLLLEQIIANVSGDSYADFIEKNIFQPLQMTNTVLGDTPEKVIKNTAVGYYPDGDGYQKSQVNQFEMGNTNVYSTVGDICKWEQNFLSPNPKVGQATMFKKMDSPVIVNGKSVKAENTAMYLGQLQYWDYNGTRKMYNISMASGYACKIIRYPDYHLSVIVLGNDGVYNGGTATMTSELYVKNYFTKTPEPRTLVEVDGIKMDSKTLESFTGDYWATNELYKRSIYLKNDTLHYARGNGYDSPIIPIEKNKFQMITYGNVLLNFTNQDDKKIMLVEVENTDTFEHIAYDANAVWTKNLMPYVGEYYSKALDVTYRFAVNDNNLVASHTRLGTIAFSPLFTDSFTGNRPYFNEIKFNRTKDTDINGFYLSVATGDKIWFEKTTNKRAKNTALN